MDCFGIPSIIACGLTNPGSDLGKAIQSIPGYVERSAGFVALTDLGKAIQSIPGYVE